MLKEKQFWNQILELAKERLTRSMFDFYATPAELLKVEGNVATIFLPRSEMEMVWSTKLNDIIVAVGFQIYDTEIKAQYVLTKEDSNTSDIASNFSTTCEKQSTMFKRFIHKLWIRSFICDFIDFSHTDLVDKFVS